MRLPGMHERTADDTPAPKGLHAAADTDSPPVDSPPPARRWLPGLRSLQFKLTAATLAWVLAFIWALALLALSTVQAKLEAVQKEQQFASVRYMAAELDHKLRKRLDGLSGIASQLNGRRLNDPAYLQAFLEQRYVFQKEFSAGTAVIGKAGYTLADFPVALGRRGTYFGDRDYFRQAVSTRQPYIDHPILGRALKRPVLTMSAPVFDAAGDIGAVLTGIVDLTAPDFLGLVTDPQLLGRSEIYLISLKDEVFVATTDKTRVMATIPVPGKSDIIDQLRAGFEGSMVSRNSQGIDKLYSAKRVPATGWIVLQALPTEVAFEPIRLLRNTLLGGALAVTLLALLGTGGLARRLLQPLAETSERLDAMSSGRAPVRQLPVAGDAEIRHLLVSFNRLTTHLDAQQAVLRRSEETYRSLFEHMLNGFAYCRLLFDGGRPVDFVYLSVNRAFETQTGLTNVLGRKVSEVVPGIRDSDPELFDLYARVVCLGIPESAEIYVNALAQWRSITVYRPEPGHFAAVFDIITERKQTEAEQQRLNRTLRLLNDSNTVLLHAEQEEKLLTDICQLLVEKGGYLMAWVGFPQQDADKTVRAVARFGDDNGYQDSLSISWADTALGRGPTGTAIRTGMTQVNQDLLANPNLAPWREAAIECGCRSSIGLPLVNNQEVLGVLTLYAAEPQAFSVREIELLESLANNLAFGIDGLRARIRLALTCQELQGFTYAASHDLRAPLGRISNFSTLLERNYRDRLEGDGLLFLEFIRQNALRMTILIDDLLAHAEVEHQVQLRQAVALAPVVQAALEERAVEMQERGVQVSVNLPELQVQASPRGLMQVLRNLLDNALKFSVQARPPVIEVGGCIEEGSCHLWVRDNGIGFDMVYHDKIFKIFRRLHTYAEYPGNGVGLALVRKAMDGMGGKVWAESHPGQGATFFLELRV